MRRPPPLLTLVLMTLVVVACSDDSGAERAPDGTIDRAGELSVFELRIGDCLDIGDDVGLEVEKLTAIPCSEPHLQEVYEVARFVDEQGEEVDLYPGEGELSSFADAACVTAFEPFVGNDYLDSDLFYVYLLPTLRSFNEEGDRNIVCMLTTTGERTQGTLRDSGR